MTEEQIKEQLSRHFLEAIANRAGYKTYTSSPDHGVDLHVHQAVRTVLPNGVQYLETGRILQVQLKSACERVVEFQDDQLRYDLSVKAYNALVHRKLNPSPTPFILVLLILPDPDANWLTLGPDRLSLHRNAYWWLPGDDAVLVDNTATKRITIPAANQVGLDFPQWAFGSLFQ